MESLTAGYMHRIIGLSLVFIVALFLAACGGGRDAEVSRQVDPEMLIPDSANFIAKVKVGDILRDLDLESIYDHAPKSSDEPQSFQELLDLALGETGIDLRKFETAMIRNRHDLR